MTRWATWPPASDEMAAYLPRLTRVLEDAAAENRNVELTR